MVEESDKQTSREIGTIESTGEHKGNIYGGIYPADNKPIWFSQLTPEIMNHFTAASWAGEQGGALPTREQGDYFSTIKDKGAFKSLFNSRGTFLARFIWLADLNTDKGGAWCQDLSDGYQYYYNRFRELPALSVLR